MNRRGFSSLILRWGGITLAARCALLWGQSLGVDEPSSSRNDLTWLKMYEGKSTSAVVRDPRFKNMLRSFFPATRVPFWQGRSVSEVTFEFLGIPGTVSVEDHRYVMITGAVPHFARCRAMLWIDTQVDAANPEPIVTLLAIDVNSKPGADFWMISNKDLWDCSYAAFPDNLRLNIGRWVRSGRRKYEGNIYRLLAVDTANEIREVIPELIGFPLDRLEPLPPG